MSRWRRTVMDVQLCIPTERSHTISQFPPMTSTFTTSSYLWIPGFTFSEDIFVSWLSSCWRETYTSPHIKRESISIENHTGKTTFSSFSSSHISVWGCDTRYRPRRTNHTSLWHRLSTTSYRSQVVDYVERHPETVHPRSILFIQKMYPGTVRVSRRVVTKKSAWRKKRFPTGEGERKYGFSFLPGRNEEHTEIIMDEFSNYLGMIRCTEMM